MGARTHRLLEKLDQNVYSDAKYIDLKLVVEEKVARKKNA